MTPNPVDLYLFVWAATLPFSFAGLILLRCFLDPDFWGLLEDHGITTT